MELRAQAILSFLFAILLVSVLAFAAGYQLRSLQQRHLITVQEVTEIQGGILEDIWQLRWRVDSLEVHDATHAAEIKSLKGKWLEENKVNYTGHSTILHLDEIEKEERRQRWLAGHTTPIQVTRKSTIDISRGKK